MPDISVSVHCNSRNEWEDFGEKQGTLNLYSYDTPDRFCSEIDRIYGQYRLSKAKFGVNKNHCFAQLYLWKQDI
mgnify:CR=1 FL=1